MLNNISLSMKKQRIIYHLFRFRVMTIHQLCCVLASQMKRSCDHTFRQNTYPDLQDLTKNKLVITESIKINNVTMNCYSLSETGMQYYYDLRDVPPGRIGTGFGGDYGEFPYELQRPPKNNLHHQIMMTEVFIVLDRIITQNSELFIDYRDNRYSSVEFVADGKKYRFRPDGEVRIGNKFFYIEVDRGTEYLEALKSKFFGYRKYFDWCQKENKRIYDGVLFITNSETNSGFTRRWLTIQNSFMSELSQFYSQFNLAFGRISDIESMLINEISLTTHYEKVVTAVKEYVSGKDGIESLHEFKAQWEPRILFHWIKNKGEVSKLVAYQRYEGCETRSVVHLFEFYNYMRKHQKEPFRFQPVFYHFKEPTKVLRFHDFIEGTALEEVFANSLWLQIKNRQHQWVNTKGEKLVNPFLT